MHVLRVRVALRECTACACTDVLKPKGMVGIKQHFLVHACVRVHVPVRGYIVPYLL